jgi:membrane fusion protein (multidrug efflux system)
MSCDKQSEQIENTDNKEKVEQANNQKSIPVQIRILDTTTFVTESKYYGSVQGLKEATLYTYGGGTVLALHAEEGSYIQKGDKLCDIDGEAFYTATLSAEVAQNLALREWESSQKLYAQKNISKQRLEQAHREYLQARSQFLAADKNNRGAYCISPIDGIVTRHYIQPHQHLTPGSKTIEIAQMDRIRIDIDVPEKDIQGYVTGGIAKVFFPKGFEKKSEVHKDFVIGSVYSVSQKVDDKSHKYRVIVHAPNPLQNNRNQLRPFHSGQTVSAWLEQKPLRSIITIPTELLQSERDTFFVLVATANEEGSLVASKRVVEVGPQDGLQTAILSGLSKGDSLITQGHTLAIQGTPIYISE